MMAIGNLVIIDNWVNQSVKINDFVKDTNSVNKHL